MRCKHRWRSCGSGTMIKNGKRDLAGRQFGKLTAIEDTGRRRRGHRLWRCRCKCGNETIVDQSNLVRGHTKSCGCLQAAAARRNIEKFRAESDSKKLPNYKHGDARKGNIKRLHRIWAGMKSRCQNPNDVSYNFYGERGIGVCPEWTNDYLSFKTWALAN